MPTPRTRRNARRKPLPTRKSADRYALYQQAVQEPEPDLDFLDRVYRKRYGRLPVSLREDFAGTALTASEWVKRRKGNTALAVDLDPVPLAWYRRHIRPTLTPDQLSRLTVMKENVLSESLTRFGAAGGVDAVLAFNFSYWIFKDRAVLRSYFAAVRKALGRQGLFLLDHFAGSETMQEVTDRTRKTGFTYIWEQRSFDPITGDIDCAISFEFRDGTRWKDAFTYHWRLWSIPELRDILLDAGFSAVEVYMERDDKDGKGTGVYVHKARCEADRALISYLVAIP